MSGQLTNLKHKVLGDRRDKTAAIHEAGFENEASAAQWANGIATGPVADMSELALIKQIRETRPDLTLATASYIAQRAKARAA
ncbi:hypothetical protein RGB72_11180 [Glutamicibacter protophormiae]|uniref:Uncharacterized protein n=1 Tax=Kocuria tytonis TaxID=2054280 RepID=A0A495A799_9MICC|nr:hypothetical protein [Kocuria tytonis]RKQ35136.1 hypothetical protein C1C97_007730 [Kocuria tytonis]WNB88512.1 hypothetical protein RGB72_11180 [Glutamicibacter protophormiae]